MPPSRSIEEDITRSVFDIWSIVDDEIFSDEAIRVDMDRGISHILHTAFIENSMRCPVFIQENTFLARGTDISLQEKELSIDQCLHIEHIIHYAVIELLSMYIIDRDSIPIDSRTIEEDISPPHESRLENETRSEIVFPDNILCSSGCGLALERIITVRILIGRVSEDFRRELSIHIFFDHDAIIDELSVRICLDDFDSFEKWLLIDFEIIETLSSRESKGEYEYTHSKYFL